MANKMLIDATHGEETRVVVVRGNKVEEFDFESSQRKQLRGNIYLAKVIRVEPSLQAAFVEYGGNRHGFLAFSEIHPDYYQIPVADRQALLEEEAFSSPSSEDFEEERPRRSRNGNRRNGHGSRALNQQRDATLSRDATEQEAIDSSAQADDEQDITFNAESHLVEIPESEDGIVDIHDEQDGEEPSEQRQDNSETVQNDPADENTSEEEDAGDEQSAEAPVESLGSGDDFEDMPRRATRRSRQYKIQEVIKRRQVILVQVVKEERGNKGAALTTYLSLAGRYSVLMPNTARGGGISRKITNAQDRSRLKEIVEELEVPEGMGVILRTAGANRTKLEVKRDFEYLLRLWETVRETTLRSSAPMLVYEEGNLVKRAIRDLYNKDIDEVLVSGEQGFNEARQFMRMLMPSHARNVISYREPVPIFAKYGVESQLDAMFSSEVTLRSGGYIVINQTEALVAIDVNSGRSTREHNIEDTALKTNLEAAEEIARQLRLRDLAGLIVCDFIDMEEKRNNRSVEKRMKECLKNDRARIQIGHISHFGLLEMSRQRIRTGVLESSTEKCQACAGSGFVRSAPSKALNVLRSIEDYLLRNPGFNLTVRTPTEIALYVLNQKRQHVFEIERRFGVSILFSADDALPPTEFLAIQKGEPALAIETQRVTSIRMETLAPVIDEADDFIVDAEEDAEDAAPSSHDAASSESDNNRRRRRRRRRRGGRDRNGSAASENGLDENADDSENGVYNEDDSVAASDAQNETEADTASENDEDETAPASRPRRRGRRGGRNRSEGRTARGTADADNSEAVAEHTTEEAFISVVDDQPAATQTDADVPAAAAEEDAPPAKSRTRTTKPRTRRRTAKDAAEVQVEESASTPVQAVTIAENAADKIAVLAESEPAPKPSAKNSSAPASLPSSPAPVVEEKTPEPAMAEVAPNAPRRTGWWQRKIFGGE